MTIRNQLCSLSFFLIVLFSTVNTYAKVTPARLSNHSDTDWTVKITLVQGTLATGSECQNNQECIIPKHTDKIVFYDQAGKTLMGYIAITDMAGVSKSYIIDERRDSCTWFFCFWYNTRNIPDIKHDGSTGAVSLNTNCYGSIDIRSSSWCGNL